MTETTEIESYDDIDKVIGRSLLCCAFVAVTFVALMSLAGTITYNQELARKQEVFKVSGDVVTIVDVREVMRREQVSKYETVNRLYLQIACQFPDNRKYTPERRASRFKQRPKKNEKWRLKITEGTFDSYFEFDKRVE